MPVPVRAATRENHTSETRSCIRILMACIRYQVSGCLTADSKHDRPAHKPSAQRDRLVLVHLSKRHKTPPSNVNVALLLHRASLGALARPSSVFVTLRLCGRYPSLQTHILDPLFARHLIVFPSPMSSLHPIPGHSPAPLHTISRRKGGER